MATETSYILPKSSTDDEKCPEEINKPPGRRADIDVIMIVLTYGVYLFHICKMYTPSASPAEERYHEVRYPDLIKISTSDDPFTPIYLGVIVHWFVGFMHAWNMPMFFYLSGQNTYFALFRRSETEFRGGRVHRLLVPSLFLCTVTQLPLTLAYFARREVPLVEESYWEYMKGFYRLPHFQQSWFLLYLFLYAQVFTFWIRTFHPAHNTAETTTLSFCGFTSCCCTVKPFSCLTRYFCCLNFILKPALTPGEFVFAVKWYLGGPIRLALIPGIVIGVVETGHRLYDVFLILPKLSYFILLGHLLDGLRYSSGGERD